MVTGMLLEHGLAPWPNVADSGTDVDKQDEPGAFFFGQPSSLTRASWLLVLHGLGSFCHFGSATQFSLAWRLVSTQWAYVGRGSSSRAITSSAMDCPSLWACHRQIHLTASSSTDGKILWCQILCVGGAYAGTEFTSIRYDRHEEKILSVRNP